MADSSETKKVQIIGSVETKDATEGQKKITEVNPCYYCFNAAWLAENIKKLANKNAQSEYYLTDLVHIACKNGDVIECFNSAGAMQWAPILQNSLQLLKLCWIFRKIFFAERLVFRTFSVKPPTMLFQRFLVYQIDASRAVVKSDTFIE